MRIDAIRLWGSRSILLTSTTLKPRLKRGYLMLKWNLILLKEMEVFKYMEAILELMVELTLFLILIATTRFFLLAAWTQRRSSRRSLTSYLCQLPQHLRKKERSGSSEDPLRTLSAEARASREGTSSKQPLTWRAKTQKWLFPLVRETFS